MIDFQVEWQGTEEATTEKILEHLVSRPLSSGLPQTIAMIGKSRTGKSVLALLIQDIIYKSKGLDFVEILEHCVLIKPNDYSTKTRAILKGETKLHKKIVSLQMDEAKFLINSDDWQKLKNKAIRTIAATSATIKPMAFFIVAQMLGDIDSKTRKTIDYLFVITRKPGQKPRVIPYTFYEKINDVDRVRVSPRRIRGNIIYPDGRSVFYTPTFRPSLPRKEVLEKYWSFEKKDKASEIFALLDEIEDESNKLAGKDQEKIKDFANHLVNNPEELAKIGKWSSSSKKWVFDKSAKQRYNYGNKEFKLIEQMVVESLLSKKEKELGGVEDGLSVEQ